MSIPSGFVRARKSRPCPVCGKPDWCLVAADGTRAVCARIPSSRRFGQEAGWLHLLSESSARPAPLPAWSAARRAEEEASRPKPPFDDLARTFAAALTAERARRLADSLGLTVGSLRRIDAGFLDAHVMPLSEPNRDGSVRTKRVTAWAFPMHDPVDRRVIGLRLRGLLDDFKFSYTGSTNGPTIPHHLQRGVELLLPEGPTSLAALLSLRFTNAVGRFNNRGGVEQLVALCRRLQPPRVIVMANNDPIDPRTGYRPGLWGAAIVARGLAGVCRCVRIVTPAWGMKDEREWLKAGATHADVRARVDNDWMTAADADRLARRAEVAYA